MRHINPRNTRQVRALTAAAFVLLTACVDSATTAPPDEGTIFATVGQSFDVTLQSVGSGEFVTPPTISSPILLYLGETDIEPGNPAGPRERFHFAVLASGIAIVTFQHTEMPRTVVDTIIVP